MHNLESDAYERLAESRYLAQSLGLEVVFKGSLYVARDGKIISSAMLTHEEVIGWLRCYKSVQSGMLQILTKRCT